MLLIPFTFNASPFLQYHHTSCVIILKNILKLDHFPFILIPPWFLSFTNTPQINVLLVPSKYIQSSTTFHHSHYHNLSPRHHRLLHNYCSSLAIDLPASVLTPFHPPHSTTTKHPEKSCYNVSHIILFLCSKHCNELSSYTE